MCFEKDPNGGLLLNSAGREFQSFKPTTEKEPLLDFVLTFEIGE